MSHSSKSSSDFVQVNLHEEDDAKRAVVDVEVNPFDAATSLHPASSAMQEHLNSSWSVPDGSTRPNSMNPRRVVFLFCLSNLVTLILTVIPVLVSSPASLRENFYNSNDIIRILEPIISLPLQLLILMESAKIMKKHDRQSNFPLAATHSKQDSSFAFSPLLSTASLIFFAFFAALYQQGAGFHSASNMFKHPIESVESSVTNSTTDNDLNDIISWMGTVWEHYISHYMYAAGGAGIAAVFAWQYRDVDLKDGLTEWQDRCLWIVSAILYGLIVGSVAVEFPYGPLVALIYVVLYGFLIVGGALYRRGEYLSWGKRFVLQYYVISYIIAFFIIIIWIGIQKGITSRNSTG